MISSEVQRTLVKSPPELWAELSDPAALARHLGELGEIRITRVDPERSVEWEAGEHTAGAVRIKPSGWGTKVTLTATRELAAPEQTVPAAEDEPIGEVNAEVVVEAEAEPPRAAAVPMTESPALDEPDEPATEPEPEPIAAPPQSESRGGFFSRLFGGLRRREILENVPAPGEGVEAASEPETSASVQFEPASQWPVETIEVTETPSIIDEPAQPTAEEPAAEEQQTRDIAAELKAAEEIAAEEVTAVLTSVLDRLGAAHHRPFSRA